LRRIRVARWSRRNRLRSCWGALHLRQHRLRRADLGAAGEQVRPDHLLDDRHPRTGQGDQLPRVLPGRHLDPGPAGQPRGVRSLADLCGATVTLQSGTIHEQLVADQQASCGANRIKARPLESGTQVVLEVKFGRADAALADFPVAAYNAKVSGQGRDFEVVGQQIDPGPYGIGVRKDDGDLQSVLQDALREIISDGSYDRVLTKWNVTDGALRSAKLTGA